MSFASFPLDSLNIPPTLLAACTKAGLSNASDVLLPSTSDLVRKLRPYLANGIDHPRQITELIGIVARAISPEVKTADKGFKMSEKGKGRAKDRFMDDTVEKTGRGEEGEEDEEGGKGEKEEIDDGKWVSTGDGEIDKLLGGGIRFGVLTEIVGESAAGKSHMCMSLALASQMSCFSNFPGGAIVLTSERELATSRLIEIARGLIARARLQADRFNEMVGHHHDHVDDKWPLEKELEDGSGIGNGSDDLGVPNIKTLLDNIHTTRCTDIDALDHALSFVIPHMLASRRQSTHSLLPIQLSNQSKSSSTTSKSNNDPSSTSAQLDADPNVSLNSMPAPKSRTKFNPPQRPIRLIILDSITALLRGETVSSSAGLAQRSRHLCATADKLKALAVEFDLAVVVVNQVSDVFKPFFSSSLSMSQNDIQTDTNGHGLGQQDDRCGLIEQDFRPNSKVEQASSQSKFETTPSQVTYKDQDPPMLYATQARWFSGQSSSIHKEASLGIVWANAVNTRIMLARTGRRRMLVSTDILPPKRLKMFQDSCPRRIAGLGGDDERGDMLKDAESIDQVQISLNSAGTGKVAIGYNIDETKPTLIRKLFLVFSPFAAPATIDFTITPSGVHAIPGSTKLVDLSSALKRRDVASAASVTMPTAILTGNLNDQKGFEGGDRSDMMVDRVNKVLDGVERVIGEDDEFEDDVYDDFGDLPAAFWEGKFDEMLIPEPLAKGVFD